MSTPIDWEMRLINEVSSAAKQMNLDMRNLGQTIRDAQSALEGLTKTEHKEAEASKESKKEHESFFGDMVKAEFWEERIEGGIDLLKELGKEFIENAEEAVDFDYKATVALTHMTGSAEQAEDILKSARAFANGVGEDFDKVAVTFQKLAATGLRGDQLTAAAAAAKDLSVVSGTSFDQVSQLFEMVGSDKGLGGRAARQLAQFPALLNDLEKHFGFVPGTAKSFEQLTKHLEQAPVKGADGLKLLENMVLDVAHETQLGDVGVEIGESFSGAAQRFKNDWKEALGSISDDPAMGSIRSDLATIADYFDPANAGGKELAQTMKGLGEPVADILKTFKDNRGVIADALSSGMEAVKFIIEGVGLVVKGLIGDIKAIQMAGAYLGALWETKSFSKAGQEVKEAEDERTLKEHREQRAEELRGMSPAERKEQAELEKVPAARELPALAPLPSMDSGGTVDRTGMVTVHAGERIVPADVTHGDTSNSSSTSMGGHTFHFEVHVAAGGEGHSLDEQLLVAKLNELTPGAIMSALEQMNQMRGGE